MQYDFVARLAASSMVGIASFENSRKTVREKCDKPNTSWRNIRVADETGQRKTASMIRQLTATTATCEGIKYCFGNLVKS